MTSIDSPTIQPDADSATETTSAYGKSPTRGELTTMYIVGGLIPIVGVILAVYLAVAATMANVRRHAIGVLATALIAAGVYAVIVVAVTASHASAGVDSQVESDLGSLIMQKYNTIPNAMSCAHQGGDQYVCLVTMANGQQQTAYVTDDGHTIYEQGINP